MNFQKAYESQIIIREIQEILKDYRENIDILEIIRKYHYTSKEAAKKLNKSHATIIRNIQNGKLNGIKIGRDYFLKRIEVDKINGCFQIQTKRGENNGFNSY